VKIYHNTKINEKICPVPTKYYQISENKKYVDIFRQILYTVNGKNNNMKLNMIIREDDKMSRTAIATDSNSGITQSRAKKLGVFVLPMSFQVNDKNYYEEIDLSQKDFYKLISESKTTVSTTQPSPAELTDFWRKILKDYDELVYIPMSSGLSSSCTTASFIAKDFGGRVHVVNNQRISVTQYQSVVDALEMAKQGISGKKIKSVLEKEKLESSIYITVNDLKYLKKGGRITTAAALIASVMNLKPVLQIQGEKLDAFSKCRGMKAAKQIMLDAMHKDFEGRFKEYVEKGEMSLMYSYSDMPNGEVERWRKEIEASFPGFRLRGEPLSLSIGCHIGPGSLAIACSHITKL